MNKKETKMNNLKDLGAYLKSQQNQVLSTVNKINSKIVQNNANLSDSDQTRLDNYLSECIKKSELLLNNQDGRSLITQDANWGPYFQQIKKIVLENYGSKNISYDNYMSLVDTVISYLNIFTNFSLDSLQSETIKNIPIYEILRPTFGFKSTIANDWWLENRFTYFYREPSVDTPINVDSLPSTIFSSINNNWIFTIENGILKIDFNKMSYYFDHVREIISNLPAETIYVAGGVLPTIGCFYLYKKVTSHFNNEITKNFNLEFKNLNESNRMQALKIQKQSVLLFNIAALLIIGMAVPTWTRLINESIVWKMNIGINKKISNEVVESLFPLLFFKEKLGKFYIYIKSKITLLLFISITLLINIYIPEFWLNINLKYSLYLIVLLIICILYFMLEVIIYISYINFKGKIEESKNLKYIPKYYLNNINNFRKNKYKDKDLLISYFLKIIYYYFCIIVILLLVGIFVYLI